MDVKQLRYFLQVYESGSFSGAAKQIYISSQGLNVALLRLEEELSCQLFVRTTNGVTLSEEGRRLLPYAQCIVAKMDEVEQYYKQPKDKRRIQIQTVGAYGVVPEIVGGLIEAFERTKPQYCVKIEELPDIKCDAVVEQGSCELGFGIGPLDEKRFESWPLLSIKTCLLVHKDHPFAEMHTVPIALLENLPIMAMNEQFKNTLSLQRVCREHGFEPNIRFSAAETSAIYRMVAKKLGVGISLCSVADIFGNENVIAIPFEENELNWNIMMFKRKARTLSPGAQALERYIRRHAGLCEDDISS